MYCNSSDSDGGGGGGGGGGDDVRVRRSVKKEGIRSQRINKDK